MGRPPSASPLPRNTAGRVSKTFTLPPMLARLIAYYRVEHGCRSESHAAEVLLQAGLDAEEAKDRAARAAGKTRAA